MGESNVFDAVVIFCLALILGAGLVYVVVLLTVKFSDTIYKKMEERKKK